MPFSSIIPAHILELCKQKWTEIFHTIEHHDAPAEGVKFSSTDFVALMRKVGQPLGWLAMCWILLGR